MEVWDFAPLEDDDQDSKNLSSYVDERASFHSTAAGFGEALRHDVTLMEDVQSIASGADTAGSQSGDVDMIVAFGNLH